jgi:hypothetical protein
MKVNKFTLAFIILLLFPSYLGAEKLHEFEEPFETMLFTMDDEHIYIADRGTNIIHIYSRDNYSHIGKFGGKGQGPTDFEYINFIRAYEDYIYVSAGRKVSYYSKQGKFIKTATPFPNSGGYIPLGDNFVCKNYPGSNPKSTMGKLLIELLDSSFKKKKVLFQIEAQKYVVYNFESSKQSVLLTRDCMKLDVYKEQLFIGTTTKGFYFIVFDSKGNRLREISVPYKKRKVTSKDKKKIIDGMRLGMGEDAFNNWNIRNEPSYKEYFPAYSDFIVTDDKIYVFSFKIIGEPQNIIELDLEGNILNKSKVPKEALFYCIYKGKYYYMDYNDNTYKWELHVEDIN